MMFDDGEFVVAWRGSSGQQASALLRFIGGARVQSSEFSFTSETETMMRVVVVKEVIGA